MSDILITPLSVKNTGKYRAAVTAGLLTPHRRHKKFRYGNPLFGTLIRLMHVEKPIIGLIDVPAMGEQWVGDGKFTRFTNRLNGLQTQPAVATLLSGHDCMPHHRHILPAPMNERRLTR